MNTLLLFLLLTVAAFPQEHLPLDGGRYLLVHSSSPLTVRNAAVTRVFILVHGLQRDGDVYFKTALAATSEAGQMAHTLVIAPQFHANDGDHCKDKLATGEARFACRGWSDGVSTKSDPLSSFTAMDRLLQTVSNRELFPALKEIVLAGHSAGGQFVQRYAATNRVDGKLPVPLRYIVANPSSYLYLEPWRPVEHAACPIFDKYKFGLQGMTGYQAATGADAIRAAYPHRAVTYLLGELDTTDEHNMDKTCPAMAQGPNRLERGLTYYQRLQQTFHAGHQLVRVPGCGHSGDCMYRSENGRKAVFTGVAASQ